MVASKLVYSSEHGRMCPKCERPVTACVCRQKQKTAVSTGDGIVRLRRETGGRKGKTVTTITGVPLAENALKELATALKKRCGSGGGVKEGVIEIQGDHRDLLQQELEKQGFKVKLAGG